MSVVTVGDFDGVHLGHQSLLREVTRFAAEKDLPAVVVTFDRNCKSFLHGADPVYLTDIKEKKELLLSEGVNSVCLVHFDEAFSHLSEREFLAYLREHCACTHLFGGSDFRFGKNGQGSLTDGVVLDGICQHTVTLKTDVMKISSSSIRCALQDGLIEEANAWLGYPYFISGTVVEGKHLGRTIGFPTANLEAPKGKILPKNGVYVTQTEIDSKIYPSVTNVGCRPTVEDGNLRNVETHLMQVDGDFYGKKITVRFLHRLRNEMRFSDLGELMQQLRTDRETAFLWHKNHRS